VWIPANALGDLPDVLLSPLPVSPRCCVELIHAIAYRQKMIIKIIASSSLFSQADMNVQSSFRSQAGIRKEATGMPAVASKWLLITQSLLGEFADPVAVPEGVPSMGSRGGHYRGTDKTNLAQGGGENFLPPSAPSRLGRLSNGRVRDALNPAFRFWLRPPWIVA
jgi:hypothetical protein